MFWSDKKIFEWASAGGVKPFDPNLVNPASIDLRLGSGYRRPSTNDWSTLQFMPKAGIRIYNGNFLLLHTWEYIEIPENTVGMLFLKSSVGRKGIEHLHACYFDPGFKGEATLEITCCWPHGRILAPGDRICQLVLADAYDVEKPYGKVGHYQGQTGPTVPWK